MIVICPCAVCSKPIEFEAHEDGARVECPHCGMETPLFIPKVKVKPAERPPDPPPPPLPPPPLVAKSDEAKKNQKQRPTGALTAFMVLIGIALILNGCSVQFERDISAIHQIYGAIQYCSGWLMIGMAGVVSAINNVAKNQ